MPPAIRIPGPSMRHFVQDSIAIDHFDWPLPFLQIWIACDWLKRREMLLGMQIGF